MGIRINCTPPKMNFRKTAIGGVRLSSTCKLTKLDEKACKIICTEYRIFNAEIICREDCSIDDLIDVIEGNRKYVEAFFVYNKIDTLSIEDVDELARRPNSLVISVNDGLNLDYLLENIWEKLDLVRVYTKKVSSEALLHVFSWVCGRKILIFREEGIQILRILSFLPTAEEDALSCLSVRVFTKSLSTSSNTP